MARWLLRPDFLSRSFSALRRSSSACRSSVMEASGNGAVWERGIIRDEPASALTQGVLPQQVERGSGPEPSELRLAERVTQPQRLRPAIRMLDAALEGLAGVQFAQSDQ